MVTKKPTKKAAKRPGVFGNKAIARSNSRVRQREAIVGKKGVTKQRGRAARARIKTAVTGGNQDKTDTIQTIKRMADYKRAKRAKVGSNAKNRLGNKPKQK